MDRYGKGSDDIAGVGDELEAEGRDNFTHLYILPKLRLKLCSCAGFWATTHQIQVVSPVDGLRKSRQYFMEVLRKPRWSSPCGDESYVPLSDKLTTLLDVK